MLQHRQVDLYLPGDKGAVTFSRDGAAVTLKFYRWGHELAATPVNQSTSDDLRVLFAEADLARFAEEDKLMEQMEQTEVQPRIHVIGVVDASGSMTPYRSDTVAGFQGFIDDLRADDEHRYMVTLLKFASHNYMEYLAVDLPPGEIKPLTEASYRTMGNTALFDATLKAINDFRGRIKLGPDDKVIVFTITDGEENDSRVNRDVDTVKTLVEVLEATGQWSFVFLAQGLDAWSQARSMGYGVSNYAGTVSIDDSASNVGTWRAASGVTRSYAGGQSVNMAGELAKHISADKIRPTN